MPDGALCQLAPSASWRVVLPCSCLPTLLSPSPRYTWQLPCSVLKIPTLHTHVHAAAQPRMPASP